MLGFVIAMLIIGVVAGYLGRLLVPGPDPMSVRATIVVGIIGSFVGGFLGYVLFGKDLDEGALQPSGIVGVLRANLDLMRRELAPQPTGSGTRTA